MKKRGREIIVILFVIIILVLPFLFAVSVVPTTTTATFSLWDFFHKHKITGNVVTETSANSMITINPAQEIGRVRQDFYGANTHGYWLGSGTYVYNGSDQQSNLTWHRETWLEGGYTLSREDMDLGSYYNNGTGNWSILREGGTTGITKEYEWARQKGVKILNIISYMPNWLGDNSSGSCKKLFSCSPSNYTYFGELVRDYINRTTLDGKYLDVVEYEFWNEPDTSFFMGGLPEDNINKSIEINKMFNATATIVRQSYPNAIIGGLGLANCYSSNLKDNFLGNFSNPNALNFSNFFSCHEYITPTQNQANIYTATQNRLNSIYATCISLKAQETCKNIYISEFNLDHSETDDWIKNTSSRTNEYAANYGLFYMASLNSYPENVSMMTYQWADSVVYGPDYPEYPHQWYSVQEPSLGLEYKPPYNVTKDFAHYHSAGSMIVNSSSSNSSINVVVSRNQSDVWHVTVIMVGAGYSNVSVNVGSSGIEALKDLQTGVVYNVSGGIVNVGIVNQYDVKNYEGVALPTQPTQENPPENNSNRSNVNNTNSSNTSNNNSSINGSSSSGGGSNTGSGSSGGNNTINNTNSGGNSNSTNSTNTTNTGGSSNKKSSRTPPSSNNNNKRTTRQSSFTFPKTITSNIVSQAKALKDNPLGIFLIIAVIGLLLLDVTYYIYKKKKKKQYNKFLMVKLNDWINKARGLGYTPSQMRDMLYTTNWDKKLIEDGLKESGVQKEEFYY